MRSSKPQFIFYLGLAAIFFCAQGAAQKAATTTALEPPAKTSEPSAAPEAKSAKPAAALREPTPEEIKVLLDGMAPLVNDSHEGLTVVEHPDGRLSLDHQGRFQNVSVAKTNADGTIEIECATSLEQIRQFLLKKKDAAVPAPVASPTPVAPPATGPKPVKVEPKGTLPKPGGPEPK